MSLLIGFLTFILVVNCVFLMLLVLVQLPKKEAGSGLAFGGGAVDTLIGAGSGNALTKMTKYSAGIFLGLAVVLAILNAQRHDSASRLLRDELSKRSTAAPVLPQQPAAAPASGTLNTVPPPVQPATQPTTTVPTTKAGKPINLTPTPVEQTPAPANTTPAQPQNTTPPGNTTPQPQP